MAYRFTRATFDVISYPHLTGLDGDQTFTLSLWAKGASTATPNYDALVNMRSTSETAGWALTRYATATRQFQFTVFPAALGSSYLSSSSAMSLTAWTHYFFAVDTSLSTTGCVRCWVNASEITWNATFTGPRTIGVNTAAFLIGSSQADGATGKTFDGEIAEVALWDTTLTDATLISNLAAGRLPTAQEWPGNLQFYAPLRDDPHDVVGSRTGTVIGAVLSTHPSVDVYSTVAVPTLSVRVQESQVGGATF